MFQTKGSHFGLPRTPAREAQLAAPQVLLKEQRGKQIARPRCSHSPHIVRQQD